MEKIAVANEDRKLKHLFDGTAWNVYDSNILNLAVGAPGTDLLQYCNDVFIKATEHRLKLEKESNSSYLFQYGPTSGGYEPRSAIAKYFTVMYSNEMKSEDLIITSGATQGLHIIISTLIDFNGYIFVDEVTYMVALDTIKQFNTLNIVPVQLNKDGTDLSSLEVLIKEKQFKSKSKEFWAMYYTIPTYHNPTGILFSQNICEGLIKLARQYDFLITCDDVYNLLYYKGGKAPKRLFAYDNIEDKDFRGNVISNGSFSKILGPGLRLGWLELPRRMKEILDASGIINSGGCLNNYTSGIVASLFQLNLGQPVIQRMYITYKERMLKTSEILEKQLPEDCSFIAPRGGYFIWITMPKNYSATKFLEMCMEEEKIYFIPGSKFAVSPGQHSNCFRLSISFHEESKLQDGALRICKCLRKFLKK